MLRDVLLISGLCLGGSRPRLIHPVQKRLILSMIHAGQIVKILDGFRPFLHAQIIFGEQAIIVEAGQNGSYHRRFRIGLSAS